MGDRCWMDINMDVRHAKDLAEAFCGGQEVKPDETIKKMNCYFFDEINYAAYEERQALAEEGIIFNGEHGEGGEYGSCVFASFRGDYADVPTSREHSTVVRVCPDGTVDQQMVKEAVRYYEILRLIDLWNNSPDDEIHPETEEDKEIFARHVARRMKGGQAHG